MRRVAVPEINPNWRNWYLVAANELRVIFLKADSPAVSGGLTSPGMNRDAVGAVSPLFIEMDKTAESAR